MTTKWLLNDNRMTIKLIKNKWQQPQILETDFV
jgi:hypothetical protein